MTATQPRVAGVMLTMTTYGTWLRGDQRGWVEKGQLFGPAPRLESHDQKLLRYAPFTFRISQQDEVGAAIGAALTNRISQRVLALTVRSWHVHFVVAGSDVPIPSIVKCAKDAVRYALRPGRPIWTEGYDKRFCFGFDSLRARITYVERHNVEVGLPARPWPFIVEVDYH